MPAEVSVLYVLPVARISTLRAESPRANSTMPVFSKTLISARSIRFTVHPYKLLQVATGLFPDVKPDVRNVGYSVGKRDGRNSILGGSFDGVGFVRQFRRAPEPLQKALALLRTR